MAIDQETAALDFSHLAAGGSSERRGSDHRKIFGSQFSSGTEPSSRSVFSTDRKGSAAPVSPMTIDSRIECRRDSTEIDLEAMGVRVEKTYTVQSRKGPSVY